MGVVFSNNTSASVTSGGTTAPSSGSTESWTVTSVSGFPTSLSTGAYFHVADQASTTEKVKVTAVSGSGPYTWTVTRGDEGTATSAHSSPFTVQQVVTAGDFSNLAPDWLNVKDYGAKGDNSHDDTSAVNAAISAAATVGGVVYFPAGTYILSSTLSLPSFVSLVGDGINVSVIYLASSSNCDQVGTAGGAANYFFNRIEHLTLDGNGTNQTGSWSNVNALCSHTWTLANCHFKNSSGPGVHFQGTSGAIALNSWLKNCRVENSGAQCVMIDDFVSDIFVIDNTIGGNSSVLAAVAVINAECEIRGNHINSAGDHGIYVSGDRNLVSGNEVESNHHCGIYLDTGATHTVVSGNSVWNNGQDTGAGATNRAGIFVAGNYNIVTGNECHDWQATKTQQYAAVVATGAASNGLTGNMFRAADEATGGISDSGTGTVLSGNVT